MSSSKSFLGLPPELRNNIYELVISDHRGFRQPRITRACRQTRKDFLELFYSTHVFGFPKINHIMDEYEHWVGKLLGAIGKENAAHVKSMRFDVSAVSPMGSEDEIELIPLQLEVRLRERDDGPWLADCRWTAEDPETVDNTEYCFFYMSVEEVEHRRKSPWNRWENPAIATVWKEVTLITQCMPVPFL